MISVNWGFDGRERSFTWRRVANSIWWPIHNRTLKLRHDNCGFDGKNMI